MIKLVVFDFDGVIVESVDIKTNAFARLFEEEGPLAVEKIVGYHSDNAGVSRYEKFKYIYKEILKRPLSDEEFGSLCARFKKLVVGEVVKAPYVKGAIEFLERNERAYKYFLISATPQDEIGQILKQRKLDRFFKRVYGAPVKKSEAVRDIIAKEKAAPSDIVYIGDALSDYKAAKDNRINFIARMYKNESIFGDIDCVKMADLQGVDAVIKGL